MNKAEQHLSTQERVSKLNDTKEADIVEKLEVYKKLFTQKSPDEWILRDDNRDILLVVDFNNEILDMYKGVFPYIIRILEERMEKETNRIKARHQDLMRFNQLLGDI